MDCSLIPKAVKVTSRRGAKTGRDGYTIHNAPIFLPLVLPAPSHFNEALLGGGISHGYLICWAAIQPAFFSLRFLPRGYDDDKVCESLGSRLHSNFLATRGSNCCAIAFTTLAASRFTTPPGFTTESASGWWVTVMLCVTEDEANAYCMHVRMLARAYEASANWIAQRLTYSSVCSSESDTIGW